MTFSSTDALHDGRGLGAGNVDDLYREKHYSAPIYSAVKTVKCGL